MIVGLRVHQPNILHVPLPAYLQAATEKHRYGFSFPGVVGFFTWASEPLNALHYDSFAEAEAIVELLVKHETGFNRPITILTVYS